ncbi:aminotransferase class I/II-fold pyridoxal phosphate-dependent enzyme [Streptomyces seoulensis]|uniref:Aminotransferase n=1 Tax=Streptomyces seoulensis TaxID=73044 RepID=A0A5P2GGF4_STRSO|nr:aminotransferase [Streptomyces seoulensis]QKW30106.1 aminotransferase class I/II-fold pyridoxal phosphate-dependent enzyme [Streptomyces seoulensis]
MTLDLSGPPRPWPDGLVRRFAVAQARALDRPGCWGTPPPQGDPALLERLAELFSAPPGRTVVTAGVRQFAGAWAGRTRTALVERPGFADIAKVLSGAAAVRALTWEELPGAARGAGEPVTFWVTSPARNPDGRSLDGADRAALSALAAAGHQVVVNQVYRWFAPPEDPPAGCWSVTSLAKLCGGGSRLGWAVLPEGERPPPSLSACGPATAWQRAWAGFLDAPTLAALRASCVEPTLEARRVFTGRLGDLLGWRFAGAGMSLTLHWRGASEERVTALFAEHGLKVGPGSAFDAREGSVRLAFSGVDAHEAAQAAERVARPAAEADGELRPAGGSPARPAHGGS